MSTIENIKARFTNKVLSCQMQVISVACILTLEGIRGGGGQTDPPLDFFGFNFLFFNRLPKALAQLFFVC